MERFRTFCRRAGLVLHVLVAGLMLFAGSGKVFGFAPQNIVDSLNRFGLGEQLRLIGVGECAAAVLLLIPWTSPLGVLLTSAFWGGAICIHMAHGELYAVQSVLLVLTWVGAYLRNPATFARPGGRIAGEPLS
jgi:hypothetical protein